MYYNTFECHGSPTLENYRNRLEVDERLLKNNMDNPVRREILKKRIRQHKAAIAELAEETPIVSGEIKKKIRFLENRGWYKDISGSYSHVAYIGLTRSLQEIQRMDWESLHELEGEMKKYVSNNLPCEC